MNREKDTFLNRAIDWLQAQLPANRLVILAAGLITAVSGTIAAWIAAHFPGIDLGRAEIAGALGAALLITIRLLDKWIDQWQHQENIATQADVEAALGEFSDTPQVHDLFNVLGTLEGVGQILGELRTRLDAPGDQLGDAKISAELAPILDHIGAVLHEHQVERPVAINAAVPVNPPGQE